MKTSIKHIFTFVFCFGLTKLFSQNFVLSTTKTNVLYQWVENPLKIVIENKPCKDIIVQAEKGQIKGDGCEFTYTISNDSIRVERIKVGYKKNGKVVWISEDSYKVAKLPDPVVSAIGHMGKFSTTKNRLNSYFYLQLLMTSGICDYTNERVQKVTKYKATIYRGDKVIYTETASGNQLSETLKTIIQSNCAVGDKIIFDNFECLLYEKEKRKLDQSMEITFEN